MQHTLIFKGEISMLQKWMKSRPAAFCKCSAPFQKVTHRSGKQNHLIHLLFCRVCGETKNMRIVCVLVRNAISCKKVNTWQGQWWGYRMCLNLGAQEGVGKSAWLTNCSAENIKQGKQDGGENGFGQERKLNYQIWNIQNELEQKMSTKWGI